MITVPPLILTLIGGLLEVVTFFVWTSRFFAQGITRWEGLFIHSLACLLFYIAWVHDWKHAPRDPKAVFGVLFSFFFPGVGLILALILLQSRSPTLAEIKALQSARDDITPTGSALITRPRSTELDKEIQPIADVLASDNLELKREAIRRLSARQDPASVQLLKKALLDPHGEVRLYAVNALSKIEGQLVALIGRADEFTTTTPGSSEAWLRLGAAYRAYAESGLLEGMLQSIYLRKAFRTYEKARALDPTNPAPWIETLQTAALLNRHEVVGVLLEQALFAFPEDAGVRLFQAQLAFETHRYHLVLEAMSGLSPRAGRQQAIPQEVTALWQI